MSTLTSHYNLIKPDPTDFEDVSAIDQNMDLIDAALWSNAQNEISNESAYSSNQTALTSHDSRITNLEGKDVMIRKGVITRRTNTNGLTADPQLTFNAIANALYKITLLLRLRENSGNQIQLGFTLPAFSIKQGLKQDPTTANAMNPTVIPVGTQAYAFALNATDLIYPITLMVRSTAGQSGAFTLLWGGTVAVNDIFMDSESYMLIERVL